MTRTQVYLRAEELELLRRVGGATGASPSELIRRAIRAPTGRKRRPKSYGLSMRALPPGAAGASPTLYADTIRGDLNERLRRLGFE